jgi:predicted ATPase/class 3 adenylate cyclase/DNA-binding CsgD family transcriptional regulator
LLSAPTTNISHLADVGHVSVGDDQPMGMAQFSTESTESGRGPLRLYEGEERERSLPTGTVTLLLSDIEGSTRLWEDNEEAAAKAVARHYELIDASIAAHDGVRPVEQGEGDSVVAAFSLASDAVAAALEVQRTFANELWPTQRGVSVRIALHTGEVRLRDENNYCGPAIIRCARLRSLAHGGQTLLSDAVRDLVIDGLASGVSLRNLGPHRLKDLGRPERVWQLCHPDIGAEFPPLRSLDVFPNNLRAQLTAFVGREDEMSELRDLLSQHRLVTLTGVGGCGKTRLALQLAAELADSHPGGTWWVELAGVSDPDLVTATVATAVGVRPEPDRPLLATLAEYLAGQDALIVLDNCEQVLASSSAIADDLLGSVPDLAMIATSREPLGTSGELAWRVPSLDLVSGVQLFIDRAALVRPGFTADDTEMAAVSRICERLDGLPLAIELAAARTRMMRPAAIAAALDDRFRLLTGGGKTAQPRQQTLEASVAWSHDLLDGPERALLRRLAVFNGGFTLEAAETVCSGEPVDSYSILDLLGRLIDKSLVQADDLGLESRYRLLETIRHFARERLLESAETDDVRNRHLECFLNLAEGAEPELALADGPSWMARLDVEHENLQSALEWAEITAAHETVLRMVSALSLFWELRGHKQQGIGGRWFARALALDTPPSVAKARALWAAGHMGIYGGDLQATLTRTPEALAVAQDIADQRTIARAGITINYIVALLAPQAGIAGLAEAIELARAGEDQWAVADGLKMMTIALGASGDYDRGVEAAFELAQVAGLLGNKFYLAWSHAVLAYVDLRRGEFAAARERLERSIALCTEVGDPITRWLAICWLGEVDARTGDYESAKGRYMEVLQKGVTSDGDLGRHAALPDLGELLLGLGDVSGAARIIEPALADFEHEIPMYSTPFLLLHGEMLLASGDEAGGQAELEKARKATAQTENEPMTAQVDHHLGRLARRQAQITDAEHLHHRALVLFHRNRLVPGIAESLEALAGIAADQESPTEAARLFGAAAAIRSSIGLARWPTDQSGYEEDLAHARQQLDADSFATAWTDGDSLDIDDVIAYASRARGERKRPSSGWASLTPTELAVVKLTARGLTNPEIGERLFIGRSTVKTHLSHVFTKLGLTSRAELASEATRRGL